MIDRYFAERFIEKIGQYMDERFMVFNTNGVIIAATETERVGVHRADADAGGGRADEAGTGDNGRNGHNAQELHGLYHW